MEDQEPISPPCEDEETNTSDVNPQPPVAVAMPMQPTTHVPTTPGQSERYHRRAGLVFGGLQICGGVLMLMVGLIFVIYVAVIALWGFHMFWGVIYLVAGGLGIASKNKHNSVIIGYMVMCIISAVFAGLHIVYSALLANYNYSGYTTTYKGPLEVCIILSLLAASLELIVAIAASAFCCVGVCRCCRQSQTAIITYVPANTMEEGTVERKV